MKASRRKSHRRSRAVSGAPICKHVGLHRSFSLPSFQKGCRLGSLDFQGAPQCTGRPCFCFSPAAPKGRLYTAPGFLGAVYLHHTLGGGGVGTDTAFAFRSASTGCQYTAPRQFGVRCTCSRRPLLPLSKFVRLSGAPGSLGAPESRSHMLELEGFFSVHSSTSSGKPPRRSLQFGSAGAV
jgi:hypothetical protein